MRLCLLQLNFCRPRHVDLSKEKKKRNGVDEMLHSSTSCLRGMRSIWEDCAVGLRSFAKVNISELRVSVAERDQMICTDVQILRAGQRGLCKGEKPALIVSRPSVMDAGEDYIEVV